MSPIMALWLDRAGRRVRLKVSVTPIGSSQSGRGQPHSKTCRTDRDSQTRAASWSAAVPDRKVLCRFRIVSRSDTLDRLFTAALAVFVLIAGRGTSPAQVVLDGKFGTSGALSGPNYSITS